MKNTSKNALLRGGAALQALALMGAGVVGGIALMAPAHAQDITSGTLNGSVTDAEGNAVSGVTIAVQSDTRGISRTVVTGSSGTFGINQLPLGQYTVTLTKDGYSTTRITEVAVQLGGASYAFQVTPVSAESADNNVIVVTGARVRAVDFSQAATGRVFDVQQTAARIPVARNVEALQLLAPQAVSGDSAFDENGRNLVSLAGASVAENIYYINGMNVTNFRTFVGGSTVPFEFYDQVQVKTGGYQAEFGRATGGAIIAVSRSGSNEMKGGVNVFWEPSKLRDQSKNTYTQNNQLDDEKNYEGNIWASGALIKDRLYFFGFLNPRYHSEVDYNIAGTKTVTKRDKPFFGGKLDADLFDGHRLEFTYFNDTNDEEVSQTTFDEDGNIASESDTTNYAGGTNMIAKYTGAFTEWLTVSALWGKSKFNQTSAGTADSVPYVLDGRTGPLLYVNGNPNGTIETGKDQRELFRADIDVNFDAFGEHNVRFGVDHEILTATATTQYSGGVYYRYYKAGAAGAFGGQIGPGGDYVRERFLTSGGTFKSKNTAFYIQDSWDVTDRLNVNLGIRNDHFKNLNAGGASFTDLKNQWGPRLGATFDVFGDKQTKLSAFFGRYYLPVAANTNIRMAGDEVFTEQFFSFTGEGSDGVPTGLTAITPINYLSNSSSPNPATLVSQNIKPQYLDEFIVGVEHRFGNRWKAGLNLIHRKLGSVLEDADLNQYAGDIFCATQTLSGCNASETPTFGSGGYILLNPGKDAIISYETPEGNLQQVTIPASIIDLPKAKRKYWAVEASFEREFDGKWSLAGSYVWSKSRGNYEGGVKSDNGQDDTGLTQDYDEPAWMDGSYGNLPNDRRHVFKLYGTYALTDNFLIGANARLASPRSFGCIGIYPFADGRGQDPFESGGADSWYCGDRGGNLVVDDGAVAPGTVLVGRGNAFKSPWEKRIDLSFAYTLEPYGLNGITLRADVFNVFNWGKAVDFYEIGDQDTIINEDGSVPLDANYGRPTSYQTPRYVRFSASINF